MTPKHSPVFRLSSMKLAAQ